jgi:hypothetical protein
MFKKVSKQRLESTYDFSEDFKGYQIVDASLGPRGEICILGIDTIPARIDGMFPPVQTSEAYNYKVLMKSANKKIEVFLPNQRWNFHFVQPIDNDNILLACARSHYYENNKYDLNAKVFDQNGHLVREFLLGDGIQDLFVTEANNIWTSYFDEGIFGNYGWNDPIGSSGLICWDSNGNEIYKYSNDGDHSISDCYALNTISNEETWFYFDTDFEVARIHNKQIDYYKPDVEDSDGFVV